MLARGEPHAIEGLHAGQFDLRKLAEAGIGRPFEIDSSRAMASWGWWRLVSRSLAR